MDYVYVIGNIYKKKQDKYPRKNQYVMMTLRRWLSFCNNMENIWRFDISKDRKSNH